MVGELPIRKDLRLVTEEGYSLSFYLRDSFPTSQQTEIANIKERHRQEDAARGTVSQMVRYYVLKTARNESECADGKGSWVITTSKDGHITSGECHISMALYPDPRSRGKANELWRDSAVLLNARAGRP